jgi:hypothetical protein
VVELVKVMIPAKRNSREPARMVWKFLNWADRLPHRGEQKAVPTSRPKRAAHPSQKKLRARSRPYKGYELVFVVVFFFLLGWSRFGSGLVGCVNVLGLLFGGELLALRILLLL